jgi:hypothetical protein
MGIIRHLGYYRTVSRFGRAFHGCLPHRNWDTEQENEGCNPKKTKDKQARPQKMSSFCKKPLAASGPKP